MMNGSLKKLKKLRGRNIHELRVRGAQLLAKRAEKYGLSGLARIPSDGALFRLIDGRKVDLSALSAESLLDYFRNRTSPLFFHGLRNRDETVAELRRRFGPRAGDATVEEAARRICGEGRFDLLGLHGLRFGTPPDFHLNPTSGMRSPLVHWSRFNELDAGLYGDKKIVWELNRCQYFATLGRAYWYSLDESYAREFVAHLNAWMDQNPPKLGVNWVSSLEVALRAISWLWALYFFKDSPHLQPSVFLRALKFLYLHARHLETYLSTYSSPNTHLTGEALGLFYLGTLLPEFRAAARWRSTGERILLKELANHVRPDGVYFEQSSYYHRYTTDFYTHLYVLARANGGGDGSGGDGDSYGGAPKQPVLEERLAALLDHLMYITRPDGTTPFFGDDDGGRLVMLGERAPNDFRAALSNGAALLGRADYKYVAAEAAEETLWLLGPEGLRAFDNLDARPPEKGSRAFEDGGYYVMRDGWNGKANYLLVDCGPHGTLNCGHAHADALSVEVAARGRTILVDPGTYTYTGSAALRDAFRSSQAHNTLTIDDESSSVPGGPFDWRHIAAASAHAWFSHERFDYFEGSHDGYKRLASPAVHTRSILFLKDDYWIVRDRVATEGAHRYELRFHFAASADPVLETAVDSSVPVLSDGAVVERPRLELAAFVNGDGAEWKKEEGSFSACYGSRSASPVCVFSTAAEGAQEFVTFLIPLEVGDDNNSSSSNGVAHTRELEAVGGRAFELARPQTRDLLLVGDRHAMVEAAGVASDFAWTWLRFERDSGRLKEMVLLDGGRVGLDGEELFRAARRIGFAVVRRAGDELSVTTEAGIDFSAASLGAVSAIVNGQAGAFGIDSTLRFVGGRPDFVTMEQAAAESLR
ncbi:MAG TPA: alginate lyase family protein [Pyrinomonadaceae bacterium]|jgi:hypothetical protein|nr:alginate lyase family protein [Pyrinomonadaceae bacterium]